MNSLLSVTIQIQATEQYFPIVLLIVLYRYKFVDKYCLFLFIFLYFEKN